MTTKILSLAAALLAATVAFADAQVYEMTLTLKTTLTAKGSITPLCSTLPDDDTGLYRKQGTVRIKGLIWGCDCTTIAEPQPVTDAAATYGYVFWNMTTGKVLEGDFGWKLLHRIMKNLKKCEGTWTLEGDDFSFTAGGFGTVKDVVDKECCTIENAYINSMNGNLAGWMTLPAVIVSKGKEEVCEKCSIISGTDDVVAVAPGFSLCECDDGSEFTAVSGTWKLKYLAKQSASWNKAAASEPITAIYSFPNYVQNYLNNL